MLSTGLATGRHFEEISEQVTISNSIKIINSTVLSRVQSLETGSRMVIGFVEHV
jgi:hypothetical protein